MATLRIALFGDTRLLSELPSLVRHGYSQNYSDVVIQELGFRDVVDGYF